MRISNTQVSSWDTASITVCCLTWDFKVYQNAYDSKNLPHFSFVSRSLVSIWEFFIINKRNWKQQVNSKLQKWKIELSQSKCEMDHLISYCIGIIMMMINQLQPRSRWKPRRHSNGDQIFLSISFVLLLSFRCLLLFLSLFSLVCSQNRKLKRSQTEKRISKRPRVVPI